MFHCPLTPLSLFLPLPFSLHSFFVGSSSPPPTVSCKSLLEIFGELRSRSVEFQHLFDEDPSLRFTARVKKLIEDVDARSSLLKFVDAWSPTTPLEKEVESLTLLAVGAYAGRFHEGCDFFLLHGITSLWSTKSLLTLFSADPLFQLMMLRCYVFFLAAAYLSRGAPPLILDMSMMVDSIPDVTLLRTRAIASNDEHIPKLVASLFNFAESSPDNANYFYQVAQHSLDNLPTPQSYLF